MNYSKKYYRNKVRFFKVLSISAFVGLVFTLVFFGTNKKIDYETPKNFLNRAPNIDIEISDSIFEGSDERGKAYQLKSKSLTKSSSDEYDLSSVSGNYSLHNGKIDILANSGKINDANKKLSLIENVIVKYGEYLLTTEYLNVDLIKMSAQNNQGVNMIYRKSSIKADSFKIDTNSNLLYLDGNVYTRFKISDF